MTFHWPWVSWGRYADMRDRAEKAEVRVDRLQDQLIRLKRVQNGRPEVAMDQREKKERTLPSEVKKHIAGWSDQRIRDQLTREARQMLAEGSSAQEILEGLETA